MNIKRNDVEAVLQQIPIDFGGGCSVSKAWLMAWLIQRLSLRTTVDIGVYRGRSLFPQALSHKMADLGQVYGIDPWGKAEAVEHDNAALAVKISTWVEETDFQQVYEQVERFNDNSQLSSYCVLVRQPSAEAISYFQDKNISFDMVHIDGNHDTEAVMKDVKLYSARLRRNGFLVLDDVSWDSVRPIYNQVAGSMHRVFERVDDSNDYAVFWKSRSRFRAFLLSIVLRWIGSR